MKMFDAVFMVILAFIIGSIGAFSPIPDSLRYVFYLIALMFIAFFILLSLHE